MSLTGYIKYNVLKKKKRIITEDYFCNKLRNNDQDKLIKKIKELKFDISQLNLNWNYISLNDNLTIPFIKYFQEFINFHDLSLNKNLTKKHLKKFKDKLEWDSLSEFYNFTLDDLHLYKNYINWKFIFFYKNTPSDTIKDDFSNKMWWLFLDDKIYNDNDVQYVKLNDMIINKNMHTIPKELIDRFGYTLLEYRRNKIIMKDVLKTQLNQLYNEFINKKKIIDLKKIDCNLFRVQTVDTSIQTENFYNLKITSNQSIQTISDNLEVSTQTISDNSEVSTQTISDNSEVSTQTISDNLEICTQTLHNDIRLEYHNLVLDDMVTDIDKPTAQTLHDDIRLEIHNLVLDDMVTDIIDDIIEDI
jgi:hypothetical protein